MVLNRRKNLYLPPRFGKHHGIPNATLEHKKVSWLELLLDLIFVWMIAQLSELAMDVALTETHETQPEKCSMFSCGELTFHLTFHKCPVAHTAHPSSHNTTGEVHPEGYDLLFSMTEPQTLFLSLVLFTLQIWRVWLTEVQLHGRLYDGEDALGRILTFFTMFAMGGMAGAASYGIGDRYSFMVFRGSNAIARCMQLCCVVRLLCSHSNLPGPDGKRDGARRGIQFLVLSTSVEIALIVVSIILWSAPEAGLVCYILSYVLSVLTTPFLGLLSKLGVCKTQLRSYAASFPEQHPEHYAERLGLMMIIVLGEAAAHALNSGKEALKFGWGHAGSAQTRYLANGLALVIIFVQFWLYFDTINEDIFDGKHVLEAAVVSVCHLLLLFGFSTLSSAIGMLDRSFLCETAHVALPSAVAWYACIAGSIALTSSACVRVISVRRSLIDAGKYDARLVGMLYGGTFVLFLLLLCMPLYGEITAFSILLVFGLTSVFLLVFDMAVGFRMAPKRGDDSTKPKSKERETELAIETATETATGESKKVEVEDRRQHVLNPARGSVVNTLN